MTTFVLDASVCLGWWLSPDNAYTQAVLESLEYNIAKTPTIWPLEVCNALLVAERQKVLIAETTSDIFKKIQRLPIEIYQEFPAHLFGEIVTIARQYQLTSYDASYLDLAMQLNIPLATMDKALMRAARKAGVELYLKTK